MHRRWIEGCVHGVTVLGICILTGLHLFHVCLGLGALAFMATQTRRADLSATRTALVEGAACFWHLVDLLWIFLFALLYLVS